MIIACYNTVSEMYPESTLADMKTKFKGMTKILQICEKVNIDRVNLDFTTFYDLRGSI